MTLNNFQLDWDISTLNSPVVGLNKFLQAKLLKTLMSAGLIPRLLHN